MTTAFLTGIDEVLGLFPLWTTTLTQIQNSLNWHQQKITNIKRTWLDPLIVVIVEEFMCKADLISFLVVFSQNENKTYNDANQATYIWEVVIDFIELSCESLELWRFSEIYCNVRIFRSGDVVESWHGFWHSDHLFHL